jgi:hypothetical protein
MEPDTTYSARPGYADLKEHLSAAWYQPVERDLYEDVYRISKKDLLSVYCINPNDNSLSLANEGEEEDKRIVKLKDAFNLTAATFFTAVVTFGV